MKTRTKEQKDAAVLITSIFFMTFSMMTHKMKRKNAKFLDKKSLLILWLPKKFTSFSQMAQCDVSK